MQAIFTGFMSYNRNEAFSVRGLTAISNPSVTGSCWMEFDPDDHSNEDRESADFFKLTFLGDSNPFVVSLADSLGGMVLNDVRTMFIDDTGVDVILTDDSYRHIAAAKFIAAALE